jgi:hypothetical protein
VRQLQFDASVDELTAASLLCVKRSPAWRRNKRLARLAVGFGVGGGALMVMLPRVRKPGWEMPAVVVAVAAVIGFAAALLYSPMYDSEVRKSFDRQSREVAGDATVLHCAMELRPNGLWAAQNGVEMLLPWTDARSVEDLEEGIFVLFRTGFVLMRPRAFADAAERHAFLDEARRLAASSAFRSS